MITVKSIAKELLENYNKNDIDIIKKCTKDNMYRFHHGVGTNIRNEYGLWHDSPLTEKYRIDRENGGTKFIENGVDAHPQHPDAISMEILMEIWELVHNKEYNEYN